MEVEIVEPTEDADPSRPEDSIPEPVEFTETAAADPTPAGEQEQDAAAEEAERPPRPTHPKIQFGLSPGYRYSATRKDHKAFVKFDQFISKAQVANKEELQRNVNLAARHATMDLRTQAGLEHVRYRIEQVSKFEHCRKETAVYLIDSLLHHMSRNRKDMRMMEKMLAPLLLNVFKRALKAVDRKTAQGFASKLMKKSLRIWKERQWFADHRAELAEVESCLCQCDPTLPEVEAPVFPAEDTDPVDTKEEDQEAKLAAGDAIRARLRHATLQIGATAKAPGTPANPLFLRAPGTPGQPAFMPGKSGANQPGTPNPGTPGAMTPGNPAMAPGTPGSFGSSSMKDEKDKGSVLNMIPATPNILQSFPATPRDSGYMPMTPMNSNAVPMTPRAGVQPVPSTPREGSKFLPMTPGAEQRLPMTPGAGRLPTTPGGASAFSFGAGTSRGGALPSTPKAGGFLPSTPRGGGNAMPAPSTPGVKQILPSTPGGMTPAGFAAPSTPMPGNAPFTPGPAAAPFTPGAVGAGAPAPSTPAGAKAAPFTPAGIAGTSAPFTPAAAKPAPFTPAGIAGTSAPFTPAAAKPAPFTPAGIAGTSAPFTPAGAGSMPFTPAAPASAPFTPAAGASAPFTPAAGASAPFTPAAPSGMKSAPFTPATAAFAPSTPAGAGAPSTPAGPSQPFTPGMSGQPFTPKPGVAQPFTPGMPAGATPGSTQSSAAAPTPGSAQSFEPSPRLEVGAMTPSPAGFPGVPMTPGLPPLAAAGTPAYRPTAAGNAMPQTPASPTSFPSGLSPVFEDKDEVPGDMTPTTPAFLGKVHEEEPTMAPSEETPALLASAKSKMLPEEDEDDDVPQTLSREEPTGSRSEAESSYPVPTAEATPRPLEPGQETPLMPGEETPLMRAQGFNAYPGADETPAIGGDVTPGMPPTEVATTQPTASGDENAEDAPAAKRRRVGEAPADEDERSGTVPTEDAEMSGSKETR